MHMNGEPRVTAIWSMSPHALEHTSFSTHWQAVASVSPSIEMPNALAAAFIHATSTLAELLTPRFKGTELHTRSDRP
jgi:hypothetical protein